MSPQPKKDQAPNQDKAPESKEDRFKRVAGVRTGRAVEAIRAIGQTANQANYTYSDEQVEKIGTALDEAVQAVKDAFAKKGKASPKFTL